MLVADIIEEEEILPDVESEVEEDDNQAPLPSLDPFSVIPEGDSFLNCYLTTAQRHPTPIEFHLFLGLQALGLAVGRRVQLFDDDNVLGNLPLILLGDTTAGKSRSLRPLTQQVYNADQSVLNWSADDAGGIRIINGAGSGEFLISKFDVTEPGTIIKNAKGKDVTIPGEPLAVSGLVVFNELSVLSAKSSGSASAFKPIMMAFIDGDKRVENGSVTRGEYSAYKPYASMLTTTQPKDLKNTLTKSDMARGLVNRFLFVCGKGKPAPAIGKTTLNWTDAQKKLEEVYTWSHNLNMDAADGFAIEQWEPSAMDAFEAFYQNYIVPTKKRDGVGVLGRLDLHMKRLILLMAINEMSTTIKLEHVESVMKMFSYLIECYSMVSGRVAVNEASESMDLILETVKTLEEKRITCSKREIYDRRLKKRGMPQDVWNEAIRRLLAPGGGLHRNKSSRSDGMGGRSTDAFNTFKGL